MTPEALDNGVIGQIEDGDEIEINAVLGTINLNENFSGRELTLSDNNNTSSNFGRNLFSLLRHNASNAENGAGLDLINTH